MSSDSVVVLPASQKKKKRPLVTSEVWPVYAGADDEDMPLVEQSVMHSHDPATDFVWNHTRIPESTTEDSGDIEQSVLEREQEQKNETLATAIQKSDQVAVSEALVRGGQLCAPVNDRVNGLAFALSVAVPLDMLLWLLNLPQSMEVVRQESSDGETVLSSVNDHTPPVIVDLLLFMGAPARNKRGAFFWESDVRRPKFVCLLDQSIPLISNRVNSEETKKSNVQSDSCFIAVRDVVYSCFQELFPDAVRSTLLSFLAGCVLFH